jgi:hypothetical protein
MGGYGSGGYVALACASVDKTQEINLPKFLAQTTNVTYGFVAGQSYVNQALIGDFQGFGGIPQLNNPNNNPGYSSDVDFVFNMGGALGDSSWLEAGDCPIVAFHPVSDPFAPYGNGPVIVPTTGDFVVDVSGSSAVIQKALALGNNNCMVNANFNDAYNQTNLIDTYTKIIADTYFYQNNANSQYDTDTYNINGTSIQVNSSYNWFRVDLRQIHDATAAYSGYSSVDLYGWDFNGTITVRFGKVNNGFSLFLYDLHQVKYRKI